MAGRALLDTSAAAALLRGDPGIASALEDLDEVFTSAIVVGELLYGARLSSNHETNLERVVGFSSSVTVLPTNGETALVYARVKQGLRSRGRPIPDNDLWIACTAIQHRLTLLNRDAHFDEIDELAQAGW